MLGLVLALISVPRALFMLVGGAIVDRYSPQRVLMLTKQASTLLLAALALGVWTGAVAMPMVCAIALGIGLSSAFSIPSGTSMLPHVVGPEHLPAANGVMMGMRQLSMFIGPLAAGLLIGLAGDAAHQRVADARGLAIAFAFDAFSFALSAWTLGKVRLRERVHAQGNAAVPVWTSIAQCLRHVAADAQLRACYLFWTAAAVLVMGPLQIALPVLASQRPELGASALGIIAGAHGAGTLLGMAVSAARPGLRIGSLGTTVLLFDVLIGLLFMPMGGIGATWQGAGLMLMVGLLGGSTQVALFTWLQWRVPPAMLGRAMSLFMFIFMGLVPMASAAAGWVLRVVTPMQLFAGCGALLALGALAAVVASPMRKVGAIAGT